MKAVLILLLLLSASLIKLTGQWDIINVGYWRVKVDFVSRDIGWMEREHSILKTTDGGDSWINDSLNFGTFNIDYLDFINDSVGLVIENGRLYKTEDGGRSWDMKFETDYLGIVHCSEDVIVVNDNDFWLKSIDGGTTWLDITPKKDLYGGLHAPVVFRGMDTAVFQSYNTLVYTLDGGITWQEWLISDYDRLLDVGFIDNETVYYLARNYEDQSGNDKYAICKIKDVFSTREVIAERPFPIYNFHFLDDEVCIAIFEDSLGTSTVMKSYDGGGSWVAIPLPGLFTECHEPPILTFFTDSLGIMSSYKGQCYGGDDQLLFISADQGNTWSTLNLDYLFRDVSFTDALTGFAVGGDYDEGLKSWEIFQTLDGGKSWDIIFSQGAWPNNAKCYFVNDTIGFIEGNWTGRESAYPDDSDITNLYQTTDGGTSWHAYEPDLYPASRISFLNEHLGVAVNDSGIYKTNDGGDTWDRFLSSEVSGLIIGQYPYHPVISSDEDTFWAFTGDGSILKFNSDGTWNLIDLDPDLVGGQLFFKDHKTGWASYYDRDAEVPALYKTEDGGESWLETYLPYQLNDICFKDSLNGWAVGRDSLDKGIILGTTNGGEDWIVQKNSLKAPLHGLDYKDGYAWAVGASGLILKMYDSTFVSGIDHPEAAFSRDFSLNVYPNPTNSILKIDTEILGPYILEFYNLNGQSLWKKAFTGKNHQIDLSSFQKGVYLITIRTKNHLTTRKVIIF